MAPGGAQPESAAYGKVTNPGRYAAVHAAAMALIDRLVTTYAVSRSEPGTGHLARVRARRAVRLDPVDGDAGSLTCIFTDFPGVILSLGGGFELAFPSCGCDACDEDPDRVVADLIATVELFVRGGLSEAVDANRYSYRIGRRSVTRMLSDGDERRSLPSARTWAAWAPR